MRLWSLLLVGLAGAACATSEPLGVGGSGGGEITGVGSTASGQASGSSSAATGGCALGSPDHCGSCQTSCAGPDDVGTKRICSDTTAAGTCDILCLGEYYDLDGNLDNGCEAVDPVVQDSAATAVAVTLPDTNDPTFMSNPLNVLGYAYGDSRNHDAPPTLRPFGRQDWWSVTAVGAGDATGGMTACLGITNFPGDDVFQICISDIGSQSFDPSACGTVDGGGASVCVTPPAHTDAGGPYYVRVVKTAGSNTANGYALFLKH